MKIHIGIVMLALGVMLFGSCTKEDTAAPGNPLITPKTEFSTAHFGDSLEFKVDVSDEEVPLSTLKAQLFYSEEMVSEVVIRTKANGEYSGKIYVPYLANVPNGTATLKLVLQNIRLTVSEKEIDLPLTRPDFPYLTLVTATGEHRMNRLNMYEYSANEVFPFSVKGYIKAPKVGSAGNEMTFGWEDNAVALGSVSEIPFSNSSSGRYSITFNTLNYQASPFIIAYAVNGTVMDRIDDNRFKAEVTISQGQDVTIDGIEDLSEWFIDPDYFSKEASGKLKFLPLTGKYRITANFSLKYFIVEAMSGSGLATLQPDGTGAVWIIGEGIGKPDIAKNQVGWNTDNALCMAPIGNKKYQVTGVAGTTFKADNINFKFFHQKGWGGEYKHDNISTTSDLIFIGNGTNGRDSGNLGIVAGKTLEAGATYVLTVDLSGGNNKAVLTVNKK